MRKKLRFRDDHQLQKFISGFQIPLFEVRINPLMPDPDIVITENWNTNKLQNSKHSRKISKLPGEASCSDVKSHL
jgi:hypothetical protein